VFPDEETCRAHLYAHRFPQGFVCPYCQTPREPFRFANFPTMLRCRACKRNTHLTAGTVMENSKQPISTWLWAAYLVTHGPPGMSALQFQKQVGIGRYETAFQMLHKLRAAMVRPGRDMIGSEYPVEVDEKWVGGATQGEGHGRHHKTLVVGAVEVRPREAIPFGGTDPNLIGGQASELTAKGAARKGVRRKGGPKSQRGGHGRGMVAGRLRLQVVPNREQRVLSGFVQAVVTSSSIVRTDGWTGYDPLAGLGYRHERVAVQGDHTVTDTHLPMIHIVFGNLDAWLLGTHHGVSPKHLQAYLNEFSFRFNRRFWHAAAFDAALGIGGRVPGPTYAGLYEGTWVHPGGWPAAG
jgi:transposase-like protein